LQLRALAAGVVALGAASSAAADDGFVAKTQVYVDSDHTTVVSPLVAATKDAWRGGTVGVSCVADVVSSASIDVVSNATTHMSDFRSEATGSVTQRLRDTTLSAAYIFSTENDYTSHNASVGVAQNLWRNNSTLALDAAFSYDTVGRNGDAAFRRTLVTAGLDASWTQTLSRRAVAQLGYSFVYDDGYQASPYRFVPVPALDGGDTSFKVPEAMPQLRARHAVVAKLNGYLGRGSVLQGDARYYFDDWGIQSATAELRYLLTLRSITVRLRERFYYQSKADFFRTHYAAVQDYMTTDRELSTFWSNLAGVKVAWSRPWRARRVEVEAKSDVFYFHYLDFALLHSRVGATVELGARLDY
jgi:hypothetical protein